MTSGALPQDSARFRRLQGLFEAALALPADERQAFVAARCGDDPDLEEEVRELLAADAEAGDFIEEAVVDAVETLDDGRRWSGRTVGRYAIQEPIGEGGFGLVYRGEDTILGRPVAVKVCTARSDELRRRFVREARISARLQHPNITTVHDFGVHDGVPYLVQEFLAGEDLDRLVGRGEGLGVDEQIHILRQVAEGLAYAHGEGVLHRDVKPANLRRLPGGEVKLMDFGIARLLEEETRLTTDGVTLGTVGYLAPEQLRGGEPDARSDLFAFGVLAFELLTGERPFQGADFSQVSYQLLHHDPPGIGRYGAAFPPGLEEVVAACMAKEPEARPQDAALVARALGAVERREDPRSLLPLSGVGRGPVSGGEESPLRRLRGPLAGLLAGLLAVALVLWATGKPGAPPGPAMAVDEPAAEIFAMGVTPHAALKEEAGPQPGGASAETTQNAATPDNPSTEGPAEATAAEAGEQEDPPSEVRPAEATPARSGPEIDPPPVAAARPDPGPPVDSTALQPIAGDPRAAEPDLAADVSASTERSEGPPGLAETSEPTAEAPADRPSEGAGETSADSPPNASPDRPSEAAPVLFATGEAGVVPPRLLEQPVPVYPPRARRLRRQAQVVVAVLVDESGRVVQAILKRRDGSGLGFDEAALEAAGEARFEPARRGATAGRMWTELPFEFRLE